MARERKEGYNYENTANALGDRKAYNRKPCRLRGLRNGLRNGEIKSDKENGHEEKSPQSSHSCRNFGGSDPFLPALYMRRAAVRDTGSRRASTFKSPWAKALE